MFAKSALSLLAEAADMDMKSNTIGVLTEGQIKSTMASFEEVSEDIIITAEMVSVIKVDNDYLVEINNLLPFMKSNDIISVGEALDQVSTVNGLPKKTVGLLVESDDYVNCLIEKADKNFKKTKNKKAKNKVLEKISKTTELSDKLKKQGYKVKKKKSNK